MKRTVGLVVALFAGSLCAGTVFLSARERPQQRESGEPRLISIPASRGIPRRDTGPAGSRQLIQPPPPLVFLKDTRSDGCWLASLGEHGEAISLATAPADACR
jgi:hypothetical protein